MTVSADPAADKVPLDSVRLAPIVPVVRDAPLESTRPALGAIATPVTPSVPLVSVRLLPRATDVAVPPELVPSKAALAGRPATVVARVPLVT